LGIQELFLKVIEYMSFNNSGGALRAPAAG